MKHVAPDQFIELNSKQDIFNRVLHCYRSKQGRCPIQHLMNGDLDARFYPISSYVAMHPTPKWFRQNYAFLERLQKLWDNETTWDVMPTVLKMLADEEGLEFNEHLFTMESRVPAMDRSVFGS